VAENEYNQEQLLGIQNIVSTLFLAESRYDIDLLLEQLLALFERAEDKHAISLFLNWFRQLAVHGRIGQEDYGALEEVYRSTEEVKSMLLSALAREKERFYQEGLEQGREEGLEQGRKEIILAMYARGFDLAAIADITGLPVEEIEKSIARSTIDGADE
jgi:predicted transposase/invertase (TIGR01784 family)